MKLILLIVILGIIFSGLYATFFTGKKSDLPSLSAEMLSAQPVLPPLATSSPLDEVIPAAPETIIVEIKSNAFSPKEIRIRAGEKVKWINQDTIGHTVTADDFLFGSNLLAQGDEIEFNFSAPGIYKYHCGPHPKMKGTVIVE